MYRIIHYIFLLLGMQISGLPTRKKERIVFTALCLVLFIYLCLRAFYVPVVHDEASTFFIYIRTFDFIPGYAYLDAANHILNSFLESVAYHLLGSHPFVLRLPNLLGFWLFAYAVFKIGNFIRLNYCRWGFWLTLLFATFLIEFFAISRGYGLAMSFMLLTIYYFFKYQTTSSLSRLIPFMLAAGLMILANLSFFYLYLLLLIWTGVILSHKLVKRAGETPIQWIFFFVLGLLPAGLAIAYGLRLRQYGKLYLGSLDGFWEVTIESLNTYFFYNDMYVFKMLIVGLGIFSLVASAYFVLRKYKDWLYSNSIVFSWLLLGSLIIIVLQAKLMKVNYPEDRAGIYLYLLWAGSLFFALDELYKLWSWKWIKVVSCLSLFFPIGFFFHINLGYTQLWRGTTLNPVVFRKVTQNKAAPSTLSAYHISKSIWAFYNMRSGVHPTQPITTLGYPLPYTHFILLRPQEYPEFEFADHYRQVFYDQYSGQRLYERTRKLSGELIEQSIPGESPETDVIYYNLLNRDSLLINPYAVDIALKLKYEDPLFLGNITAQRFVDDAMVAASTYSISRNNAKVENGVLEIQVRLFLTAIDKLQPNRLVVYIYNKRRQKYHVLSSSAKLYKLPLMDKNK